MFGGNQSYFNERLVPIYINIVTDISINIIKVYLAMKS
jgi:hypothetical protein